MAIVHRIKPKYKTRMEATVAKLRAEVGAGPPIDPAMKAKRLIAEAAIQMALWQGGDWRVEIDPHSMFVLISRRQKRTSRSRG